MPIYEYQCKACGHQMEAFQKFSDAPLTDCPVCHQSALNKLISASGFQLKGSGWYATDYKSSSKPDSKKGTESPAETKTADAKPADTTNKSNTSGDAS